MLIRSLLSEFGADIAGAVKARERSVETMREAVYNKLRTEYETGAQAVIDQLHGGEGPQFELTAK